MIKEINEKFGDFHDTVISSITYSRSTNEDGKIVIAIRAINLQTMEFENVSIVFEEVLSFRLIELEAFYSLIINSALIIESKDVIVFDFFPDIYSDRLELNEGSDFIIKCKRVSYKVLD